MRKIFLLILLLISINIFSAKYVFFFLGDGMGLNHLTLANEYSISKYGKELNYNKLNNLSFVNTKSLDGVTDSAAAITAIMSFEKTNNEKINIDKNGNKLNPVSYYYKDINYNISVITSNSIVDASPAGIYAKTNNRKEYTSIANQLLESQFDLFIGGGKAFFNQDDITKKGYIYKTKMDMTNISKDPEIILTSYANNPLIKDSNDYNFYQNALEYSLKKFGENNFFIFIEGGRIDHASHAHDSLSAIDEVIGFDKGLKTAIDFYNKHPKDTIIIFTADHETGGLSLGDGFINVNNLSGQKYSYETLIRIIDKSKNYDDFIKTTGLTFLSKDLYNKAFSDNVISYFDDIIQNYLNKYNSSAGIKWSTFGHTINNVPIFSDGIEYNNFIDSTDIFWKIIKK